MKFCSLAAKIDSVLIEESGRTSGVAEAVLKSPANRKVAKYSGKECVPRRTLCG